MSDPGELSRSKAKTTSSLPRHSATAFASLIALILFGLFIWSTRPAFYYMEFIVMIFFAPILLGGLVSFWPIYLGLRKRQLCFGKCVPLFISLSAILLTLIVSLPFQGPLKLMFLTARPALDATVPELRENWEQNSPEMVRAGIYSFRSPQINGERSPTEILVFRFKSDGEQAFIHSPDGIDNLRYNSGNKGHLVGDWHWMCED